MNSRFALALAATLALSACGYAVGPSEVDEFGNAIEQQEPVSQDLGGKEQTSGGEEEVVQDAKAK